MNKAQLNARSHRPSQFDENNSMEANNWMNTATFNGPLWHFGDPLVQSFCQGVIVSNEWVLTHADCNGFQRDSTKMKETREGDSFEKNNTFVLLFCEPVRIPCF